LKPVKIINVCGARPNFMKIAPLMAAYRRTPAIEPILVHTGQHYDDRMSRLFFDELGIPRPDINLEVGSASQAVQTAEIMKRFEPVVLEHKPAAILVVGDVNSTVACALVAAKLGVKVVHVEAGLRSFDRSMPEEINRLLTDTLSDLLFVSEPSGLANLKAEGVAGRRVLMAGNVMIDTLLGHRARAEESRILETLGLEPRGYGVLTLHRPSNVDDSVVFNRILDGLEPIAAHRPIVFPIHPRTRLRLAESGLRARVDAAPGLRLVDPLGYLDFLKLMASSLVVLTDSGGIQEETTILHVPCLTLRENTERPVTVDVGTNRLVGTRPEAILSAFETIRAGQWPSGGTPPLWDGRAADRIAARLAEGF
jgi:UDP-N-acetylglucosamine 2-epimerase (non-hydrolysing)